MKNKITKVIDDGKTSGIKIEEYNQEDDISFLAIRLAEELHCASAKQKDYESFSAGAFAERKKALNLQDVIFKLKERQKNPPKKVSRMDPLNFYELETCEEELKTYMDRAKEMQEKADMYANEAQKHRNESQKIQIKIRRLRTEQDSSGI